MAGPATLAINIVADASKATKEMKSVGDTAKTTGSKLGGMAGALGGALAVGAVVSFGKSAVGAAEESRSAIAGLETVFRNTGDATGQAAADAVKYAGELSALIGVEDEQILAAQTTLASFTAVSDETARASGVFDRATTAAADLAAAGFGSLETNAATLGKILEDPAKGLAKVQKFTGPLTDSQKDLITSMAEAGDVAGAQAAVLDILEGKVGGTAAATATGADKMAVGFGEVSESVGNALLPAFDMLVPILQTVAGFLEDNMSWLLPLVGAILAVVAAIKIWSIVQGILNVVMAANPIVLVVLAVLALIAVVVLIIKNWDKVTKFLKKAWETIKKTATVVFGAIGRFISGIWEGIKRAVETVWNAITGFVGRVWDGIRDTARTVFGAIRDFISGIWQGIKDKVETIWNGIYRFIKGIFDKIKKAVSTIGGTIRDVIAGTWEGIVNTFKGVVNFFIGGINNIIRGINKVVDVVNKVPGINVGKIPEIPKLARGGVLTRPTLFLGGEAGREIVSPERLLRAIIRQEGGGGGYTLNINPRQVNAQDVAWGFRRLELARTGR